MITSAVDCVTEKNFKSKHTQAEEEASMDMLTTGHTSAANVFRDATYSYIENILKDMSLEGTLNDLHIRNLIRWSEASKFVDALTQWIHNLKTFTNPLATFFKKRMNNTVDEWHLNAKEGAHPKKRPHRVAPPLLRDTSSSKDF